MPRILLDITFDIVLFILTYLAPKRAKLVVFVATHTSQLKGNLKYLAAHLANEGYEVVVFVDRNSTHSTGTGIHCTVQRQTLSGLLLAARAQIIIVDHGIYQLFRIARLMKWARMRVINTWHGTGFKQIGYLDTKHATPSGRLLKRIFISEGLKHFGYYEAILASSKGDRERKARAFRNKNVVITGNPRNDIFFKPEKFSVEPTLSTIAGRSRKILYAPTFRDTGTFSPFSKEFWTTLDRDLAGQDSYFFIRRHPKDAANNYPMPAHCKRIVDVSSWRTDTQELLVETDMLISDYSGIVTDFLITSRPIIWYLPDWENYRVNCRELYYLFPDILSGPIAYTDMELIALLRDRSWSGEENYIKKYTDMRRLFHEYSDGDSCERVALLVENNKNKNREMHGRSP